MTKFLSQIYEKRFAGFELYRLKIWKVLINRFFYKWIDKEFEVLDLGSGYGEFINQAKCSKKHAMDLNPKAKRYLSGQIQFHQQDCSEPWSIEQESLDLVFTSNFFEHLPDKKALENTIQNIHKALRKGGKLIAMGPNIAVLKGRYWDFWDHHVPLSLQSMEEILEICNFEIESSFAKFLPYNMIRVRKKPIFLLYLYLRCPLLWKLFGKQFLVIAKKI